MVDLNREKQLRDAIELMYFAYRSFTLGPDQILAGRGLNRAHHRILYFVGRHPGLSVTDLLDILQVKKQALNAPLRKLLEMKLIYSRQAKFDGRVRQLRLTPEGRRLEASLTATQLNQLEQVFSSLAPVAECGWRECMEKLAEKSTEP